MKLMAHQLQSVKHSSKNPIVFDASDAGTGKTAVRIEVFARRRRKGGGCLLVLAPRSLLESAWAEDFMKFAPDMSCSIARASNREQAFAVDADVYITNHDAVKWLVKQPKKFFKRFSEVAIDEATAFKHHTSQRSRALDKILNRLAPDCFVYRAAMTATPTSNGIIDIWHQMYLLDGGRRLGPSFFGFRNSVCEPIKVGRHQYAIEWRDKVGAEEAVFGILAPITVRHKLDECADLPANHIYQVPYQLTPAQQKTYDQMEASQLLLFPQDRVKSRLTGKPAKVTAVNAAAVWTKLAQIASGAVYTNDRQYKIVDTARYELILDLVEAREHSLVLYLWNHQQEQLIKEAEKRKVKYCVYGGDTSDAERAQLVRQYQDGLYQVMFAHPKTAGHGLTLTRGTRTIWASPTPNAEWWMQASRRQHRIGQDKKTETIVVLAKNTIDERVYNDILMPKDGRMKNLLDLFSTTLK